MVHSQVHVNDQWLVTVMVQLLLEIHLQVWSQVNGQNLMLED